MKVSTYLDAKPIQEWPGVTKRDVITDKDGAPNFAMRVFEVGPGISTPLHSHPWEHEVFILSGQGVVISEQRETKKEGSVIFIPPNEPHHFTNKGNEPLRFVCLIPLLT